MNVPGVFVGTLRHRRFTPVAHEFAYPACMVLLDIDRIAELMRVSRLTSHNRWNWATFDDRDHLGDPSLPLRTRLAADAAASGLALPDGPIFLLTHLRYFGYCFNPVSFYYTFDRGGSLRQVMAEVHNTFGGAHNYWLNPDGTAARPFRAAAAKQLYVSPFMPVDVDYGFVFTQPGERLSVHMDTSRAGVRLFDATLTLERRPWTAGEIRRQLLRHPFMTMQVTKGIHWQALKLWWKGVPLVRRATADGVDERAAWQATNAADAADR